MTGKPVRIKFKALEVAKKIADTEQSGLAGAAKLHAERETRMNDTDMPEEYVIGDDYGTSVTYRLKSTVDAERAADSKTIRELEEWRDSVFAACESTGILEEMAPTWGGDIKGWGAVFEWINYLGRQRKALSDHEPRIASRSAGKSEMNITITITHKTGRKEIKPFTLITQAVSFAESVVKKEGDYFSSVLMQGPDGEREFIS